MSPNVLNVRTSRWSETLFGKYFFWRQKNKNLETIFSVQRSRARASLYVLSFPVFFLSLYVYTFSMFFHLSIFISLYTILYSPSLYLSMFSISLSFYLFILFYILHLSIFVNPFKCSSISLFSFSLYYSMFSIFVNPFSMFFHISIFLSLCTIPSSIFLHCIYFSLCSSFLQDHPFSMFILSPISSFLYVLPYLYLCFSLYYSMFYFSLYFFLCILFYVLLYSVFLAFHLCSSTFFWYLVFLSPYAVPYCFVLGPYSFIQSSFILFFFISSILSVCLPDIVTITFIPSVCLHLLCSYCGYKLVNAYPYALSLCLCLWITECWPHSHSLSFSLPLFSVDFFVYFQSPWLTLDGDRTHAIYM